MAFIPVAALVLSPAVLAQDEDESVIEEVYVTAQKREQSLLDIPMSVTVLGGDSLERQQADSFEDLVALVPGLSITGNTPGVTRITLRGINTGGVASTVGVYYGDVPFGSSGGLINASVLAADFDTFDLDRIEVLRGPQGTLYGASSVGGVLKYVPNAPSTEGFEARLQGTLENVDDADMGYAVSGLVNIPLGDRFAVRLTGFSRTDEGYIDSIGNNPLPSLVVPGVNVIEGTRVAEGINAVDTYGGRVSALFRATENFSLELVAMGQNIDAEGRTLIDADPVTLEQLNSSPVQSQYHFNPNESEYRIYSGILNWNVGNYRLESVTSDATLDRNLIEDLAYGVFFLGIPFASFLDATFGAPMSIISPQVNSSDKFTQEFRLLSPESDKFEWLLGLYYSDEDNAIVQEFPAVSVGTNTPIPGIPELLGASIFSKFEEKAVFANATWYITPSFELSFGIRATDNEQSAIQTNSGILLGLTEPFVFPEATSSESPTTWSVSPRYELNDHASIYARVATGYRPGGPNILPPGVPADTPASYDSDELTSYEIGYRVNSEDGKFALDMSAFLLDWEDIQLLAVVNNFGINANGGTAESKGFEFSAAYQATDQLNLTLNAALTDAVLTNDTHPIVGGLKGDPLPYVPEFNFSFGGEYEWTVNGDSTAYVGGTVNYVDDRPTGFGDSPTGGRRIIDNYTTVGLRAGLVRDQWTFEVYAKNLTDEDGITSVGGEGVFPGAVGLGLIRPRTFGLTVGTRF